MYNLVAVEGSGNLCGGVCGFGHTQLLSPEPIAIEHGAAEYYHECQSCICERRKGHVVMA